MLSSSISSTTKQRSSLLRVLMLVCMASVGCSHSARDLSLDQPKAREVVTTALTAWKDGKQPADLKPGIIVGDVDWEAGKKLVSFETLPGETNDGTNLHIPVQLTLQDQAGQESKPKATYTVGTSPVVTMIRE